MYSYNHLIEERSASKSKEKSGSKIKIIGESIKRNDITRLEANKLAALNHSFQNKYSEPENRVTSHEKPVAVQMLMDMDKAGDLRPSDNTRIKVPEQQTLRLLAT